MKDEVDVVVNNQTNEELKVELACVKKQFNNLYKKIDNLVFLRNLIILSLAALLTLVVVNRTGAYPWGSDTYGHLFKGNILYDSLKKGKFFLNYNESWYNGVQPYRYWAPLPYYILAIINLVTNNIITTYNVFIALVFIIGGLGWLFWGYYTKRQNLSLILAIMWFFIPNNLRILFSEGNIPYVIVNSLVPFVFLHYYKSIQEARIMDYLILAAFMSILTLTHAMLSAMTGISLFILAFADSTVNKRYLKNLSSLAYAFMGIMASSFWLYPALKGGIMSIDKSAVADVMKDLTYPLITSLNPLIRFSNIEVYYFGLAFALTAVLGLLVSTKNERAPFISALIILIGTTKAALPVLQKLPMNQVFWMSRFTSIAMAMIIMAIMIWKRLRKSVLVLLILIMIFDSAASFYVLGFNGQFSSNLSKTLDTAARISTQRIGVLDNSYFGSFPSYYIAYNSAHGVTDQVYGWAWQGAATSKNIVMLNTALERGYYDLMFDRALELGADTLVVKKSLITDFNKLQQIAATVGYEKYGEDDQTIIYKYPGVSRFGTTVNYEGIAIGSYSTNAVYIFPKLQVGDDNFLDDYTYDELKNNKIIYLSGFKYKNKKTAEDLVLKLSRNGVKVVIDGTGLDEKFLGVTAEPITLDNNYQEIYYKNEKLQTKSFPDEYSSWKTCFFNGIENKESYEVTNRRLISYIGKKDNDNLTFIGLNIPYYAFLTKDSGAVRILEDAFNLKAYELPKRETHKIDIKRENNTLSIISDASNIIVPIAALDAFVKVKGDYEVRDNLIYLKTLKLDIKIIYPYLTTGIVLSLIFLTLIVSLSIIIKIDHKKKSRRRRYGKRRRAMKVKPESDESIRTGNHWIND